MQSLERRLRIRNGSLLPLFASSLFATVLVGAFATWGDYSG